MRAQTTIGIFLLCASLSVTGAVASAAETAVASLESVNGRPTVTRDGRPTVGTAGMELRIGDRAFAGSSASAVIRYKNGCVHKLESEDALDIDAAGPCCLEPAIAFEEDEVVARFGRIEGRAMANLGTNYVPAREGLELRAGNRAMAMENSTAVILYTNGCRYRLRDDQVLKIDAQSPCCAAVVPADRVQPAPAAGMDNMLIPAIVGGAAAICAVGGCSSGGGGGGGGGRPPISP